MRNTLKLIYLLRCSIYKYIVIITSMANPEFAKMPNMKEVKLSSNCLKNDQYNITIIEMTIKAIKFVSRRFCFIWIFK